MAACIGPGDQDDCVIRTPFVPGGCERIQRWTVTGGTPGTIYNVTVRFVGIVECKTTSNCQRRNTSWTQLQVPTEAPIDMLCTGGTVASTTWSVYDFRVQNEPAIAGTSPAAVLNSGEFPCEDHYTYPISEMYTFQVRPGSTITFRHADSNCLVLMNCGPATATYDTDANCRANGRILPGVTLPPQYYGEPYPESSGGPGQPFQGQFVQIQLVSVTPS
jgi:hypothetical protein